MSGKSKKERVKISEDPPAVREIEHRSEVLEIVPIIDPITGQLIYVPVTEEYRRKHDTTTREEQMAAAIEARSERKLPWWQRGYKNEQDARQKNKKKDYNPATGKWEGGKTKKRRNKKRRTIRKRI